MRSMIWRGTSRTRAGGASAGREASPPRTARPRQSRSAGGAVDDSCRGVCGAGDAAGRCTRSRRLGAGAFGAAEPLEPPSRGAVPSPRRMVPDSRPEPRHAGEPAPRSTVPRFTVPPLDGVSPRRTAPLRSAGAVDPVLPRSRPPFCPGSPRETRPPAPPIGARLPPPIGARPPPPIGATLPPPMGATLPPPIGARPLRTMRSRTLFERSGSRRMNEEMSPAEGPLPMLPRRMMLFTAVAGSFISPRLKRPGDTDTTVRPPMSVRRRRSRTMSTETDPRSTRCPTK